jgi:Tfp pilus assembly protein PilV
MGLCRASGERPKSRAGRAGMSMAEVLIALFLLGLFVTGTGRLFLILRGTADFARTNYQAVNLAKARMERVRVIGFSQLNLAAENNVPVDEFGNLTFGGRFRRSTVVTDVGPELRQVLVTVDILNPRTRRYDGGTETIETLIGNFGIVP